MTAEDFKQLASLLGGTVEEGPNWISCVWDKPDNHWTDRSQFRITFYTDNQPFFDRPAECFDLLDRMEANGLRPSLRKNKQMNQGELVEWFECWDTFTEFVIASGKTRTEAIVRLFLEVIKPC